jgi:periplasmic protein TonB
MFEDALLESSGRIRAHRGWHSGAAAVCNGAVVCLLIALPLFHPASLPKRTMDTLLAAPAPPAAPVQPNVSRAVMRPTAILDPFAPPQRIPEGIHESDREPAPAMVGSSLLAEQAGRLEGLPDSIGTGTPPPAPMAVPQRRQAVSSGVMEGRKLSGVVPRYPAIAVAAHIEGTVVLTATISKTGAIENLHVVSGSPTLIPAAEDAVRTWRYRPYLLNGEPIEVETTVTVVFRWGS